MTVQDWLVDYLRAAGAVAGTVHQREGDGLRLYAASNIPELVQSAVRWVPRGKGMAGLAFESGEAVQTCNLKDDSSGQVRPGGTAGFVIFMTVLGGFANFFGPVVGAFAFVFLKAELTDLTQYWRFWLGAILILLVVLFPRGLSGLFERMWARLPRSTPT